MFKKAVDAKSHQRLSGADRKKLRRTIRDRFSNASDALLDVILPPKAELSVSKYPNRVLVYGLEGECPMFFDVDGRGRDIFPTVTDGLEGAVFFSNKGGSNLRGNYGKAVVIGGSTSHDGAGTSHGGGNIYSASHGGGSINSGHTNFGGAVPKNLLMLGKGNEETDTTQTANAGIVNTSPLTNVNASWIVDSGASDHMTSDLGLLYNCHAVLNPEKNKDYLPTGNVVSTEGKLVYILVYMDDLLVTGNNQELINQVRKDMQEMFKVKDLGELKFFLGIEIARSHEGIVLCQRKYALELISEAGLSGAKPANTPLETNLKLTSVVYDKAIQHEAATGYLVKFGGAMVSWKAKKQETVSRSSAEAEFRRMAACTAELTWLTGPFKDTVYALWRVPELLPAFVLKGGEVSRFMLGGADLMFPGISIPTEGFPSFSSGEPWAVKVPGNPAAIAVGTTTMSSTEALKAGLRGKALKICHYYRDTLWESAENCHVPNAGFLEDVVFEDPALSLSGRASDSSEVDPSVDPGNMISNEDMREAIDADTASSSVGQPSTTQNDGADEITLQLTSDLSELKVAETYADESNTEGQHSLCVEEVDALLDKCLLQALHTTIKEKDLPIPGSTFWSSHVLPCRPPGITLDIKKSSHKKLSKWLQAKASGGLLRMILILPLSMTLMTGVVALFMVQNIEDSPAATESWQEIVENFLWQTMSQPLPKYGIISVKEDKHKKEVILFYVNRNHPDYMSYKPEKKKVDKTGPSTNNVSSEERVQKSLEVSEIYKPSVHVNPIFASVGAETSRLYTASETSGIVFQYVEKENLVKPSNKSTVTLDATLCDALFKGAIKKGSTYPTEIHKKDLGQTFIGRMQAHHCVTRGNDTVVRKGALKPIQIMTERRQGNKKVTKLSGMESFLLDAETLASELQKKCACSTTVAELPGKKGEEVLVQGGVIDDLARYLVEQYGVPKKYIEVLDKTKR
uniref:SUI1 domain-containing protein n=1 Tax=Solanum lycopersicum TaxID=4081 RepID=A0A3Q7IWU7_SOLLC